MMHNFRQRIIEILFKILNKRSNRRSYSWNKLNKSFTFIEQNNLENKQIFIFVTSGGSTASGSFKHLKEKYSNLNFIDAKTLNHIDEQTINDWI